MSSMIYIGKNTNFLFITLNSKFYILMDSVDTRKTPVNFYNPLRFPRFPGDRNPAGQHRFVVIRSLCGHFSFLIDYVDTHKTPYNVETSPRGNIGLSLSGRFAGISHFSFLISHFLPSSPCLAMVS